MINLPKTTAIPSHTVDWQAPLNLSPSQASRLHPDITITELFAPDTQDVDTFNHAPVVFQDSSGVVHVAHVTGSHSEDYPGQVVRYRSRTGGTWGSYSTVLPALSTSIAYGASQPASWTFAMPVCFLELDGSIYIVGDVHQRISGGGPRSGVAIIAAEIIAGVGQTPVLIHPTTYTPAEGFPDYEFDAELSARILPRLTEPGTVPWVWALSDVLPRVLPVHSDGGEFYTQSKIQLPDGTHIIYARKETGTTGDTYLWKASSPDGFALGPWSQTNFPNSPSKWEFGRLANGNYWATGNAQNGSRQPLAVSYSADGLTWKDSNTYSLTWETVSTSGGIYRGSGKGGGPSYVSAIQLANGNMGFVYSQRKERIYFLEATPPTLN